MPKSLLQIATAFVFVILLGSLPVSAQGGKVSPAFQFKSNPLIRITAAEVALRFPTLQNTADKDLKAEDREHVNRIRYEVLQILKGLQGYYGILNFAKDFITAYEEEMTDRPQSLSEDLVYAWAMAYKRAHGTGHTTFDFMSDEARVYYQQSLKQLQDLPEGLRRIEQPEMTDAEKIWLSHQAYGRAITILEEARSNTSKPLSCESSLQSL